MTLNQRGDLASLGPEEQIPFPVPRVLGIETASVMRPRATHGAGPPEVLEKLLL
jgi:hypothetical protein